MFASKSLVILTPSAWKPLVAITAVLFLQNKFFKTKIKLIKDYKIKALGEYREFIKYPSDCLVSDAITQKSLPEIAKDEL